MDKKEIYEHLANIYLDASSKKKKKSKPQVSVLKSPVFVVLSICVFIFGVFSFAVFKKNRNFKSEVALVVTSDVSKINFNFNPAKKEVYSLNLNRLNLTKFNTLSFSLKKANFKDIVSLRVEFTSKFNEKSEVYLKNIPHKWCDYKIKLFQFKKISNWQDMVSLAFAVEEWNTKEKSGVVYIDNIRFLR